MKILNRYSERKRKGYKFTGDSLTKQSFKDECDVNQILAHHDKTGTLVNTNTMMPQYLDADIGSYQDAMFIITRANSDFEHLPSDMRARFGNSVPQFLDFINNPKNKDELITMGLIDPLDPNPPKGHNTDTDGTVTETTFNLPPKEDEKDEPTK